MKSMTETMLGCCSILAVRASASAAAVEPAGAGMPSATRGMRLMATRRCRRVSRQISTLPKPPVARVSSGR